MLMQRGEWVTWRCYMPILVVRSEGYFLAIVGTCSETTMTAMKTLRDERVRCVKLSQNLGLWASCLLCGGEN